MKKRSEIRTPRETDETLVTDNGLVREFDETDAPKPRILTPDENYIAEGLIRDKKIALPPYVFAQRTGARVSYVFMAPPHVRPQDWPQNIQLGEYDDPEKAYHQAWEVYGQMLHIIHQERMARLRETLKNTVVFLGQGLALFAASQTYKDWHDRNPDRATRHLSEILRWSELNDNPPAASIAPEHVRAFELARENNDLDDAIYFHMLLEMAFNSFENMDNPVSEAEEIDHDWFINRPQLKLPPPAQIKVFTQKPSPAPMVVAPR